MWRGLAVLAFALVGSAGCEPEARTLDWRIRFESADLAERAVVIEARVRRGGCADATGAAVYSSVFPVTGSAPAPARLRPGIYAVEAYARDASCIVFAGDCSTEELPTSQSAVELVLQERPGSPACAPGDTCSEGRCESERMPDAGPRDAAVRDAPGADAGYCPPEDAADGTGRECNGSDDCPAGMICYGDVLGFLPGKCTRDCDDDDACVPGWSCERVPESYCSGGCPTPICACDSLLGFASETACNGQDGDCDGRIDEGPEGGDICGNGVCTCGACICDPGWTDCGGVCVDTATDRRHCGGCGMACAVGFDCVDSSCTCLQSMCGSECVDTQTNESHCGSCDRPCDPGFTCSAGECVCMQTLCGGQCVDVMTHESHCGECGSTCDGALSCCGGACVDLATDPSHCGACGMACPSTRTCCDGSCVVGDTCP